MRSYCTGIGWGQVRAAVHREARGSRYEPRQKPQPSLCVYLVAELQVYSRSHLETDASKVPHAVGCEPYSKLKHVTLWTRTHTWESAQCLIKERLAVMSTDTSMTAEHLPTAVIDLGSDGKSS